MFYARIGGLNELWNDFHSELTLPQHDPIWTQTVNRLLFNSALISCIGADARQNQQPSITTVSAEDLGVDEEYIIRYMAGLCHLS